MDVVLCELGVMAGVVACLVPAAARLPLLLGAIALMNVVAFGGFNPIQPAEPIFNVPDTAILEDLRRMEASTPGHYVASRAFIGATLNGMGIRSISHILCVPKTAIFRKFFPDMDPVRFDFIFNRYGYIHVTDDRIPNARPDWSIRLPVQAFEPNQNSRTLKLDVSSHKDCTGRRGGVIERVTPAESRIVIEGWAPWKGEEPVQELRVSSARALRGGPLITIRRTDISEAMTDYAYTRSGFKVELASSDNRPIRPGEIAVQAGGTDQGRVQVPGCGCP
jgi:hypothetical protein